MALTLVSGPSVEPVTLSEVKEHLRLDSGTFAGNLTETQTLPPSRWAVTAATYGTGVDVLGNETVFLFNAGTLGALATVTVTIQESDDNSTYTDWGSFTAITTATDNSANEKAYTGVKQYVRAKAVVTQATSAFGVTVIENAATFAEDDYLTNLITAARNYAETYTRRQFIHATWDYYINDWPSCNYIEIPKPPLASITSIVYKDTDATEATFSTSYYTVDTDSFPGRAVLDYGEQWPTTTLHPTNPIKIRFIAGYGTTRTDIPMLTRQAILLYITELHENRGVIKTGTIISKMPSPFTVNALLDVGGRNYRW